MNNFTYFNDKSAVYMNGSGDDTDDEDWSISTKFKCHPCKKDFASSGQLKKHNKQHIGLNNSNSAANKALKNAKLSYDKQTLDNSLLLQEDEDEEEEGTTKKPRFVLDYIIQIPVLLFQLNFTFFKDKLYFV